MLGAGLGDKIETRADDEPTADRDVLQPYNYEAIRNYMVAVFDVNDQYQPTALLTYYVEKGKDGEAIFPKTDENTTISDEYGFFIRPLKFRTAGDKVALVVLANCDNVYQKELDTEITNYDQFQEFVNGAVLPLMKSYLGDNQGIKFKGYPMSSNVYIIPNIVPGMCNTVGYAKDGKEEDKVEAVMAHYGEKTDLAQNNSTYQRIALYRCWSQVELTDIKVDTYTSDATEAKFDLTGAFLMNVPVRTKAIDQKVIDTDGYYGHNWFAWGAELNEGFKDYIYNQNADGEKSFYSGFSDDADGSIVNSDKMLPPAYTKQFRTADVAENTVYEDYFTRLVSEYSSSPLTITSKETSPYSLAKLTTKKNPVEEGTDENNHLFNYVVSASNYGLDQGEAVNDKAMVLVVEGVYKEKIGNVWVVPNQGDAPAAGDEQPAQVKPRYYTIVINENGTLAEGSNSLTKNIANTVMRNVKYDISAVIKGPGSDTPVAYQANTYVTSKVTIVPFGHVTQVSEID